MDLALKFDINDGFDIQFGDEDFLIDNGFETYVLMCVFSDARIVDSELPLGELTKRGWWANDFSEIENDNFGSKIWTLLREKKTNETRKKWEDAVLESLQIMKNDGIASNITVTSEYDFLNRLILEVVIEKPSGENSQFELFWDQQELKVNFN